MLWEIIILKWFLSFEEIVYFDMIGINRKCDDFLIENICINYSWKINVNLIRKEEVLIDYFIIIFFLFSVCK